MSKNTVALIILDGFGYSETSASNAIKNANNPVWDDLWKTYPHSLIQTSGMAVGLPEGQMGNSEVGHMNLGAGRTVYQNFTRINKDISDDQFKNNKVLVAAVDKAIAANKAVHIVGLLSPGGVHSHEDQIASMVEVAVNKGAKKVYVHAITDGRDTAPKSAKGSIELLESRMKTIGGGQIVSLIGRYYAMDRDNRWERVQLAYDLYTQSKADIVCQSAVEGLAASYAQDKFDEFVPAVSVQIDGKSVSIEDGDSVIFMNFRPDRAREITRAFVQDDFEHTLDLTVRPTLSDFVMLTEFAGNIPANCAYPPATLVNTLGEFVQNLGKTQLRIAETEKYAHVTFFFSGGREDEYEGEDRILIPSPNVATYDLQPEMNAPIVTEKLVEAIESGEYDLVICNYANGDMVGHTGNMEAAIKAVEALDVALKEVTQAILKVNGHCLITADHGNVELMLNPETGEPVTSHTTFDVPLVYVSNTQGKTLENGSLCDIAPTLLELMNEKAPVEMTGSSLLK
ncbi:MAG: 2,3-bisphosphoglycerate-independent phosphoglycerate mutase [Saccharospirillaceae bacterium]|nr:2,3-bisphosphoglycerate-independent phosphoglycerate mutase [Pseudomonadales bacterium]NRB79371.1 2,3-bisphosphoglycerate-independent phosphoglycerate mutase [Saccharospirillaceae bacterium]